MSSHPKFYRPISLLLTLLLIFTSIPWHANRVKAEETNILPESDETNSQVPVPSVQGLEEVASLRAENAKVYENTDGSYVSEVFLDPIHYKKNGKWEDIDNTLVENSQSDFENKSNKFKVKFPKKANNEKNIKLFTYEIEGRTLQVEALDNEPAKPKVHTDGNEVSPVLEKGKQIRYKGLYEGVTFDYVVDGTKVKENIILDSYRGKNVFQFFLKASGMKAFKKEDGSIEFRDEKSGKFLFFIQRPYMYDSAQTPEISQSVSQEITKIKDGFMLTVAADEEYLTNSKRVYPVIIDPWIDVFQPQDSFVSSANVNTNYSVLDYLSVGNTATLGKTRTYIRWNLPQIPNAKVTQGSLGVYQSLSSSPDTPVSLHRVTSTLDTLAVKWATQPSYDSSPISTINMGTNVGYKYFSISDLVKGWYDNTIPNYGVLLKYADSQELNGQKQFRSAEWNSTSTNPYGKPKLVITYRPRTLLGITDYWTYTPDLFNGEGNAVVNVLNGNMVYEIPLLSLPGRKDAFNLKLVYNSRTGYDDSYGYRWTMSAARRLIPNNEKTIIEYLDGNGTRFHFNKQQSDTGSSFTSPEGTYFELNSQADGGYSLKQPDETMLYFDSLGRNTKVVDEKGNTVIYSFDGSSNRITKISERFGSETTGRDISLSYNLTSGLLEKVTDFRGTETIIGYDYNSVFRLGTITYAANRPEKKTITFGYDGSHQMETITDAKGNKGQFRYDSQSRVTHIIDPRSENIFSELSYPTPYETVFTDANGAKTYYRNNGDLDLPTMNVVEIIEGYGSSKPISTKYEWKNNQISKVIEPSKDGQTANPTTSIDYDGKGNAVKITNPDGSIYDNVYDDKSNVTQSRVNNQVVDDNGYDSKSNLIFSSDQAVNTGYSTYDKYGNALTSTTTSSLETNLVPNRSFESYDANFLPLNWGMRAGGGYTAATESRFGNRSGKITVTGLEAYRYYFQNIAIPILAAEEPFTISGYIKTENLTGTGAQLVAYFQDSTGQFIRDASGSAISYSTHTIKGTKDWTAISNTFAAPKNTAFIQVLLSFNGAGAAYFDGIQLNKGSYANEFVSNENEGMESGIGTTLDNWTLNSLGTGDGKSTLDNKDGKASARLTGNSSASRSIGQLVQTKGKTGSPVTISGWANASSPNQTGEFSLQVSFVNTDGTESKFTVPFDRTISNEWQFIKQTFRAVKDFNQVKIYGYFNNQSGTVFFDNIKLEERSSVSSTVFDTSGNFVKETTDALNQTTGFVYDENGNLKAVTSPKGNKTSYDYNFLNQLRTVTKAAPVGKPNISISYEYDKEGNLEHRINPRGYITSYEYNEINQLKKEIGPLGKYIGYDYHPNGNLKAIEIGKGTSIYSTQEFIYDSKNLLKEMKIDGNLVSSYSYDDAGNVNSLTYKGDTYSFKYDAINRLESTTEPGGYKVENQYGNDTSKSDHGLRTTLKESTNGILYTTSFSYDLLTRLSSVTASTGAGIHLEYNEKGMPVQERFMKNGVNLPVGLYKSFDELGRITSQNLIGSTELELKYSYNKDGKLQTYSEGNQTQSFTYDYADRLDTWTGNGKTVVYQYDFSGNLLNPNGKSLTFNAENEVDGFEYDEAGNLKKDESRQYEWNKEGRLVEVKNIDGSTVVSYTYYPNGQRKTKTTGETSYQYHYDGGDLLRITDKDNKTVWAFTWIDGKPKTVTNKQGQTFFYITNYRGDVVSIIDDTGLTVASYSYDPWGNIRQAYEQPGVANQPFGYAGYQFDKETKLYYLQARYYDPDTSRFISRDPYSGDLDNPITQNAYVYAFADPISMIDPQGTYAASAILGGSLVLVPGIGEAILLISGIVIVSGAIIYTGSKIYSQVQKKAASDFNNAVKNGSKTKNHSEQTEGSLPVNGKPYSSKDLIKNGKVHQRRYYDKNGKPKLDIDYSNHGNPKRHPKVPHRHDWINGVRQTTWY
ncbi:DNRLRE domain-containing protein [Bacillus sp. FJAT-27445]|uniref:DNRLRE domain-containing protein n=1 Tax=Bacillus sp. FJAT-27445 TaxID=1679166 RepID=UPI0007435668|nr:DNRLRE domain-containing protein [Bacillus sp. FJAT-27445]